MKKRFLSLALLAILAIAGCQNKEMLEQQNEEQTSDIATWMKKNTILVDTNYTTNDGKTVILYETIETHQQFFVPRPTKSTPVEYHHSISHDGGDVVCAGNGSCCNFYFDNGSGFIEVNPRCWKPGGLAQ